MSSPLSEPKVRCQLRLAPATYKALEDLAARQKRSINNLLEAVAEIVIEFDRSVQRDPLNLRPPIIEAEPLRVPEPPLREELGLPAAV